MRKNLISPIPQTAPAPDEGWLDLDAAALVEVTSKDEEYPSSPHWYREEPGAGVPPIQVPKPSA